MQQERVRVGVVDNDSLSLRMLAAIVRAGAGLDLAWAVSRPAIAIQACVDEASRPHVLLVDMALGGTSGIEVCAAVRRAVPSMRCVGVTAFDPAAYEREAAGLCDEIVSKDDFKRIPAALLAATHRPESDNAGIALDTQAEPASLTPLSARELETLRYYAQGLSTNEILAITGMSKGTLRTYEDRALRKLHARNRTEAVSICERHHLFG